jgi:hypothetical protein
MKNKQLILDEILKFGTFTETEIELIYKINDLVMSVDGIAEGWGGYRYDPINYVETSIEIFNLIKNNYNE